VGIVTKRFGGIFVKHDQVSQNKGFIRVREDTLHNIWEGQDASGRAHLRRVEASDMGDTVELIERSRADVVLEMIPNNYETGQPALDYIMAGLRSQKHVISASKAPIVHGYNDIQALAKSVNRMFKFESAVMDGVPVFNMWQSCLKGTTISKFDGVLNSTTNFILTQMEQGQDFPKALKMAQEVTPPPLPCNSVHSLKPAAACEPQPHFLYFILSPFPSPCVSYFCLLKRWGLLRRIRSPT
jgi:homoserine dehydrogenase